jgi:hypothetical protein
MAAVRRRGPDPVPRAVAVAALVAVAAVALQARQGLDWDRLAEPLDVRWSRLVVGLVLVVVLVAWARRVLRRLRRFGTSRGSSNALTEPEGEPVPWWLRALAALLILATMAAVFYLLTSLGTLPRPEPPPPSARQPSGTTGEQDGTLGSGGTSTSVLVAVVVALLVAAVAARWYGRRQEEPPQPAETEERTAVRRLAQAVDAAEEELGRHADARQAVLAAYAAMARHLSTGVVRRGGQVPGSDTATELLDRAVTLGLVTGGPARALTDLFREARFSSHPMGEDARGAAESCLAQVRDELAARRG